MANDFAFSNMNLELDEIFDHHSVTELALKEYYSINEDKVEYHVRFAFNREVDVADELGKHIEELAATSSFSILSSLEASFRVDFLVRCKNKKRDILSRRFREIYKKKKDRIKLEDDILDIWKEYYCTKAAEKCVITDFIGALKYRNWLAHGRYWEPTNWGRQYDYETVSLLAELIHQTFDLYRVSALIGSKLRK